MLVIRSDAHRDHHCVELDGGVLVDSWDTPARADSVDRALDAAGRFDCIGPDPLDRGLVEAVHTSDYVAFLEEAHDRWVAGGHAGRCAMGFGWPGRGATPRRPHDLIGQLGYHSFAADCSIGQGTWAAAVDSAALAQTAADRVADGASSAFARCRPPGHHAMRDQFGGYCYLNNAAVAAQRLRARGADRVVILDVDYHHGNGTQDIFYDRDDVLYCSIHCDPLGEFPFFSGHADETGTGEGTGWNYNLSLPKGTSAIEWFEALEHAREWIEHSGCDHLVVSLGVDTFEADPISHFRLGGDAFAPMGERLAHLGLPTVFVLEGGYASDQLGDNVVSVLVGFGAA